MQRARQVREERQYKIRAELDGLTQGSKEVKTSRRLLEAVEKLTGSQAVDPAFAKYRKTLEGRLARLKRVKGHLEANQRRDLLIILLFGAGKLQRRTLEEACSILCLHGDEESVSITCRAFPGLRDAFKE